MVDRRQCARVTLMPLLEVLMITNFGMPWKEFGPTHKVSSDTVKYEGATTISTKPGLSFSSCFNENYSDHAFRTYKKFSETNISYPLIRGRTSTYQGVRKISFSENFAFVLNGWSLTENHIWKNPNLTVPKILQLFKIRCINILVELTPKNFKR